MSITPTRRHVIARWRAAMVTLVVAVIVLMPSMDLAAQPAAVQMAPDINTRTVSGVAQRRIPSVVFIHVGSAATDPVNVGEPPASEGIGSGVIIDPTGLIVTNAHVVGSASRVNVEDADGRRFEAAVVGKDSYSDLAIVRPGIAASWRPAPLGRSGSLATGNWVVAIGNPIGLHHTVTLGIVSGLARSLSDDMPEFVQTDAAINPGSSGGGLFDLEGRLVGITSGSYSQTGGSIGLNFAIPVDLLRDVLPQLKTGSVAWGWIGVTMRPLATPQTGGLHGNPGPIRTRVVDTVDGGPASRAGIRDGDIVVGVGGRTWPTAVALMRHIRLSPPGTVIRLQIVRSDKSLDLDVDVERPPLARSGPGSNHTGIIESTQLKGPS